MAAVAQLKADPKYSAVHELLHIFSVEKLGEYMAFHQVCVGTAQHSAAQHSAAQNRSMSSAGRVFPPSWGLCVPLPPFLAADDDIQYIYI